MGNCTSSAKVGSLSTLPQAYFSHKKEQLVERETRGSKTKKKYNAVLPMSAVSRSTALSPSSLQLRHFRGWRLLFKQPDGTMGFTASYSPMLAQHMAQSTSTTAIDAEGESVSPAVKPRRKNGNALSYEVVEVQSALKRGGISKNPVVQQRNVLGLVQSRYIVNMRHAFQDANRVYLVLDGATRGTLAALLSSEPSGTLPEAAVKYYTACLALGLQDIHRRGIAHGRLGVAAVAISTKGEAKLTDFSAATVVDGVRNKEESWRLLRCLHQALSDDWYDLGTVVYELLTGIRFGKLCLCHVFRPPLTSKPLPFSPFIIGCFLFCCFVALRQAASVAPAVV